MAIIKGDTGLVVLGLGSWVFGLRSLNFDLWSFGSEDLGSQFQFNKKD